MCDYEWEKQYQNLIPKKDINSWYSNFGFKVISRFENNNSNEVKFTILVDNEDLEIFIVGNFNNWEFDILKLSKYKLKFDSFLRSSSIILSNINHRDEYKFLVVDKFTGEKKIISDPAGVYFSDEGNSIFWDFEGPQTYKQKYSFINNFERSVKILQTDLPGLIVNFENDIGEKGSDFNEKSYYKFIVESGIIEKIKDLGFNTVQFLPFAQSIDGDNWKFRYLVPFQFAIQKNWGNPDEFAEMIDEFHKADIAVIGDFVIGHLPDRDYKVFGQNCDLHGLQVWKKKNGDFLYLKDETSWGTRRLDFDSKYVRDFFISSCLHFLKYYKIDGFRIDNVDGIIRYGDNGDGFERENGRVFLRELNSSIYDFNPFSMINFEAHYYVDDNAKMLVAPLSSNIRSLGATAYNSSRVTYYFHTSYMLKTADEISVWKFKYIAEEKEWGKSNSTVADFHNHDAAAGLMENRCTGSYAYDAMTHNSPINHVHALGKIKVMEALISFWGDGRTLDLIQTFLLQKGTFEHNSSIEWDLEKNEVSKNLLNFKSEINKIQDNSAFWVINVNNREFLNIDDVNKIMVIERKSELDNFIIVINLGNFKLENYKVGVKDNSKYKLIFNSDEFRFAGFGYSNLKNNQIFESKNSDNFELFNKEIKIGIIAPYNILIFKKLEN